MSRTLTKNMSLTVKVDSLSHEGRGITHIDGKTCFVDGGLPGESLVIQITANKSQYCEAVVLDVLEPSPARVEPKCEYFGVCGGCRLQHIHPEQQIIFKQDLVLDLLQRVAKLTPREVLQAIAGPHWGYRTKARLGARYVAKKDRVLVGFRELAGRYLTDMDHCHVLHPQLSHKLTLLGDLIRSTGLYRDVPQIEVAVGDEVAAIIIRHLKPFAAEEITLIKRFGEQQNLHVYLQPHNPASVHKIWPETGAERLQYHLPTHQLTMHYHPNDFTQVNLAVNAQMIDQAIHLLALQSDDQVLDLFCGLGNFSLPIAKQVNKVVGVEGSQTSVDRAEENAHLNSVTNAAFYKADLTLDNSMPWATCRYDKVLLDPPRAGALEALPMLRKWQPSRIVYVSCNPATLARDAAEIVALGYHLESLGVMDMFPHTHHVESMALFVKER